jgi:peroxiredoxin
MVDIQIFKMKKCFVFITFLFLHNLVLAQDEAHIQREIEQLHVNTRTINDSVLKLMAECKVQIKSAGDSNLESQLKIRMDDLWNTLDRNLIKELRLDLEYAKQHPSSAFCLQLIRNRINRFEGMGFYEEYEAVYQNFSWEIRNSEEGKIMAEQLKYFKQSMVGSIAPEFTVKDLNGKQLSLSDFRGKKYVLIDFWASWCAPCREEIPYIKDLYNKYDKAGFEIINASRDEDLEDWKRAIVKEGIASWRHFSIKENDIFVAKDFYVNGIPHKVLIDKNGVIVGKWKGGGENNKRDLQRLLEKIFDVK